MKTLMKLLVYRKYLILSVLFITSNVFAKSTDMGVCFLKTDKQTLQSKINEIAVNSQQNTLIQQQVRFFNDLTNLFVPVDTFNYKLFWVQQPNNDWLQKNCFKYGYITLMDYNRRAITRVYSNPVNVAETKKSSRNPASAVPQADPPSVLTNEDLPAAYVPFDPQVSSTSEISAQAPGMQQQVQPLQPQAHPAQGYMAPQINLYNYYSNNSANGEPSQAVNTKQKSENETSKKEESLNVNVNVGDNKKSDEEKNIEKKSARKGSVYDLPSYLEKPSYFLEISPFMGYEKNVNIGSGTTNKFGVFAYGTDLKWGYRFNQHFNYYFKGRYMALELRSIESTATVDLSKNSDISYGFGVEHVASRFLSLAIEYNGHHLQSFEQVGLMTNVESVTENFQTVNLDFKLNFVSRDDFKFGLHGNYGIMLADNSDELIYDFKTKLYFLRGFENDYFGLNFGYEQNKFLYAMGPTSETTRKRFVIGLNFGFDF